MLKAKLYKPAQELGLERTGVASTLRDKVLHPSDPRVVDISSAGCAITTRARLTVDMPIGLGLPRAGVVAARVTRKDGTLYDCVFDTPLPREMVEFALCLKHREPAADPEPVVERYPLLVRLAVILGSAALLWALIVIGARALR